MSITFSSLKQTFANNIKNVKGWRTARKIVVFSVDDYGNVKLDSKQALLSMEAQGVRALSRFDQYDALEDEQDLRQLYEVLSSVKDINGNHAIFTAFALPANINFEKLADTNYQEYHYELLPETYSKLKGYESVMNLWKEGIRKNLIIPQFHGREHINIKVLEEALRRKDEKTLVSLKNRSYVGISPKVYPSYTAAFDFYKVEENEAFNEIITDGLKAFEKVFGYRATHFNPPGGREHPLLHKALKENGIKFIDTPFDKKEHQGNGRFKRVINYMGKRNVHGQFFLIRNVVFEPTNKKNFDWVEKTLQDIAIAFRWNKPAVISSHRVNFSGHIDENNRKTGLEALQSLLNKIIRKWPDVEFMAAHELGELIASEYNV